MAELIDRAGKLSLLIVRSADVNRRAVHIVAKSMHQWALWSWKEETNLNASWIKYV